MRGTKAKALRRHVSHLPESTAVQQYGRSEKPVLTGKLNLDGTPEVTTEIQYYPLTLKHNGRRQAYQQLKGSFKLMASIS